MPDLTAPAILSAGIDWALPRLMEVVGGFRVAGIADECDLIDRLPDLCVAGPGANVHRTDAALTIDLGGDDKYLNSAGGADEKFKVGQIPYPIVMSIDLGGNDQYLNRTPTGSKVRGVQGSAVGEAIGILVDVAGDDRYSIGTARPVPRGLPPATPIEEQAVVGAIGQGVGIGPGAFGMLQDFSGNDEYEISSDGLSGTQPAFGMGAGIAGSGVFVDNAGDDKYRISAVRRDFGRPEPPARSHPSSGPFAAGFGAGLGRIATREGADPAVGFGLFADGGGEDSMALSALSRFGKITFPRFGFPSKTTANATASIAFGFGVGTTGAGAHITGDGSTRRTMSAISTVPLSYEGAMASGFGAAVLGPGSFGGLLDVGGDDFYSAKATSGATIGVEHDAGCGCFAPAEPYQGAGPTFVFAMGVATLGLNSARGFLHDGSGDDVYEARSKTDTRVFKKDVFLGYWSRPWKNWPFVGGAMTLAQGVAAEYDFDLGRAGSRGVMLDDDGDDSYSAEASSHLRSPSSSIPLFFKLLPATVSAQAVGRLSEGNLIDTGGGDSYEARASQDSAVRPHERLLVCWWTCQASVQGSVEKGHSYFLDIDEGDKDVLHSRPADPACSGTRGVGTWKDCGEGDGQGRMGNPT